MYSRSGKSKKYPNFVKVTGYGTGAGLGGWNCSHSFRPWFEGMSRTYSKEILEDYNAKKFEYNGKKLTEYEALQEQRKLERNIRRWKREQNALRAAGLDTSEATAKVKEWNGKHKDFLEQTGLKADGSRLAIGNNLGHEVNHGFHNLTKMAKIPDVSNGGVAKSTEGVDDIVRLDSSILSQSNGSPEMVSKLMLYNDATEWITKTTAEHAFYYD
ncbi:MAG: hypothetical protein IKT73_09875, partial [Anaerotignum sp.]|nr:hypothetical protein [Anaerotignum sp.]